MKQEKEGKKKEGKLEEKEKEIKGIRIKREGKSKKEKRK